MTRSSDIVAVFQALDSRSEHSPGLTKMNSWQNIQPKRSSVSVISLVSLQSR